MCSDPNIEGIIHLLYIIYLLKLKMHSRDLPQMLSDYDTFRKGCLAIITNQFPYLLSFTIPLDCRAVD
jgi:hypothetical protein